MDVGSFPVETQAWRGLQEVPLADAALKAFVWVQ